MDFCPTFVHCS